MSVPTPKRFARGVPGIFRRTILNPMENGASPFPCPEAQPPKRNAFRNVAVKATTSARPSKNFAFANRFADNLARTELRTEPRISRSTTSRAGRALQGPGLTPFFRNQRFLVSPLSLLGIVICFCDVSFLQTLRRNRCNIILDGDAGQRGTFSNGVLGQGAFEVDFSNARSYPHVRKPAG